MSRQGESVTISLSASEKEELEAIALELGCTWGKKGNISALMQAIAERKLQIVNPSNLILPQKDGRAKKRVIAINKIKNGLDELGRLL